MWFLVEEKEPPKIPSQFQPSPLYWLGGVQGDGRTIGRKHVDIRLKASSVSRTHARINVLKAAFYSPSSFTGRRRHRSTCVSVQDSSAYGTFLKYPPGHASNRSEEAVGHHRRLDKDMPTEVCEGALLAFGAPSLWWRLGWENIVLVPTRISGPEKDRLALIAAQTSAEIADVWSEECTHLVTHECVSSSIKVLTILAEGKHIVTPAWAEALRHTVTEACGAITESANDDAAMAACKLADEKLFIPPFAPSDQAIFSAEELNAVFEPAVKERRVAMFKGIVFAFNREERRARWAALIEKLGGSTTLAKTANPSGTADRVVFVQGEQGTSKKSQEGIEIPGRAYVQESALSAAIIRAELAPLDVATSPVKSAAAEVTDVATPGPLDSESEADTEESEPGDATKQGTGQDATVDIENAVIDVGAGAAASQQVSRSFAVPKAISSRLSAPGAAREATIRDPARKADSITAARKRARAASNIPPGEASEIVSVNPAAIAETAEHIQDVTESIGVKSGAAATPIDNSDVNERAYFKVDEMGSGSDALLGKRERRFRAVFGQDVRPFRRRKLPAGTAIPLKRVRCVENTESGFERGGSHIASRSRGDDGDNGAQVLDSEEE